MTAWGWLNVPGAMLQPRYSGTMRWILSAWLIKMIRKTLAIILTVLILGCTQQVRVTTLPCDLYDILFGPNIMGFCIYQHDPCEIFMRPFAYYETDECLNEILNHELEHCFRGPFHGDSAERCQSCFREQSQSTRHPSLNQ